MMRANVAVAGGQIVPHLTRAVGGITERSSIRLRNLGRAHRPGLAVDPLDPAGALQDQQPTRADPVRAQSAPDEFGGLASIQPGI